MVALPDYHGSLERDPIYFINTATRLLSCTNLTVAQQLKDLNNNIIVDFLTEYVVITGYASKELNFGIDNCSCIAWQHSKEKSSSGMF